MGCANVRVREVGLGDAGGGREAALVGGVIAAERPDVVQGSRFAAHDHGDGRGSGFARSPALASNTAS